MALGVNPHEQGVVDTPRRFANMWREFIEYDPGVLDTTFTTFTAGDLVIVKGIRVWSVCEHHLIPFWCDVTIGYIPNGKVLGLSKFARICHHKAHKPQLQERLVTEIADEVSFIANTRSVAVIAQGEHLCMTMRGIKSPGLMVSSTMRGAFDTSSALQSRFLVLSTM